MAATACFLGCGPAAGEEGSKILVDYGLLSGGVVFATRAVASANGYDLFWANVPPLPTTAAQPLVQLTEAGGNEWQPSVSPGGNGLAYVRPEDGVFIIGRDSVVRRVSRTDDRVLDSLPAVSFDGQFVAWVREDKNRPIAGTGFLETAIWIARSDGSEARPVAPKTGVVQDAPRFEPVNGSFRLAWSEFDPASIGVDGPEVFGLWVHDFRDNVGRLVCQSPGIVIDTTFQRCFGQHLAWPRPNVLIVPQSFMEVYLDGQPPAQVYTTLLSSAEGQQLGGPVVLPTPFGYSTFPVSASYLGDRMIFDGIVNSVEGNSTTLSLWVAVVDGTQAWRLQLGGHLPDIDVASTRDYLFSVATPQLIP